MKHTISLIIGDWSHDGHCMSETVVIKSSLSDDEIQKAFKKGTTIVGFNWEDVCADYEDNSVDEGIIQILKNKKINISGIEVDKKNNKKIYNIYNYVVYAEIYLAICKLGNSHLKYSILDEVNSLPIGGYGLFSN